MTGLMDSAVLEVIKSSQSSSNYFALENDGVEKLCANLPREKGSSRAPLKRSAALSESLEIEDLSEIKRKEFGSGAVVNQLVIDLC